MTEPRWRAVPATEQPWGDRPLSTGWTDAAASAPWDPASLLPPGDQPLPTDPARYAFGPFTPTVGTGPALDGTAAWPAPTQPPVAVGRRRSPLVVAVVVVLAVIIAGSAALVVVDQLGDRIGYQNAGYVAPPINTDPPAVEGPRFEDEAYQTIRSNPLYGQAIPQPIKCELPRAERATRLAAAELEAWLNEASACLITVWHAAVEGAGFEIYRPGATTYGRSLDDTPCGELGVNAAFCGANQQFYWSTLLLPALAEREPALRTADSMVLLEIFAHEFGHAVQYRAGISQSVAGLRNLLGVDSDEGKQINRRLELQADCFSGLFLRAVTRSLEITEADLELLDTVVFASGDQRAGGDHGQPESRVDWFRAGLGSPAVSTCNTFNAPASRVS